MTRHKRILRSNVANISSDPRTEFSAIKSTLEEMMNKATMLLKSDIQAEFTTDAIFVFSE